MKIKGTVTYVPLSGGFWGITTDDGGKFRPVKAMRSEFCAEGLVVEAEVEPAKGFSIFMWGTDVEVKSIQKVNP